MSGRLGTMNTDSGPVGKWSGGHGSSDWALKPRRRDVGAPLVASGVEKVVGQWWQVAGGRWDWTTATGRIGKK